MKVFFVLLFLLFMANCGSMQVKKNTGELPKGLQFCATIEAKHDKQVHKIYACTPSLKLCQFAINKAKDYGNILGLKGITECRAVIHP